MVEKHYVQSSNVEAVGYDVDTMSLHVWFISGTQYMYSGVPEEIFHALLTADSVGSMLHREVKGTYEYTLIG